jgi:hypothetical protein
VRLEGPDAKVDRGRRIPDENVGGIGRRPLIRGLIERKACEERGLAPLRLIEVRVDGDVGVDARRRDSELSGAAVVDGRRRDGELKRGNEGKNRRWD